jgi:hypothetical protein
MRVLREQSAAASQELTSFLGSFLQSGRPFSSLGRSGLGASEATEVEMIVAAHRAKLSHPGATVAKVVRAMLKPLYVRGAICKEGRVRLGVTQVHYRGLRDVLEDDEASRGPARGMAGNVRVTEGLSKWPLEKLKGRGVICFERAMGRMASEHPGWKGRPTAKYMRGLIHTEGLPTAVGGASDHYVLVGPDEEPRWLSVLEVARTLEVVKGSPLYRGLTSESLTTIQAVSALGRGIHVGVARGLLAQLREEGRVWPGMTYGSAWSGIDTFAAAVDEMFGDAWEYRFASESVKRLRGGLIDAWGTRGLTPGRCHSDAVGEAACGEERVTLWVSSPECNAYSKRNHRRGDENQDSSVKAAIESFKYIESASPDVVVVENVNETCVVGPFTGVLRRIAWKLGYELECGAVDARADVGALASRERYYWVLKRKRC